MTVILLQRMTRTTLNVKLRGNCYFWLVMHLLSLWPPSLRVDDRLLETEKALKLNFAFFFGLKTGGQYFLLRAHY